MTRKLKPYQLTPYLLDKIFRNWKANLAKTK